MPTESLKSLMNAMVSRLEFTQKETLGPIPEDKYWSLIQIYVELDEVLATLYKQYCDAKDNLGKLVIEKGSEDPMTEIAWDMHESAKTAVETRLLELKDNKEISERAAQLKSLQRLPKTEYHAQPATPSESLDQMMVFMLWASMVMKNNERRYDIRRDFVRAR